MLEFLLLGVVLILALFWLVTSFIKVAVSLQSELQHPIKITLEDFASQTPPSAPSIFSPAQKRLSIVIPAYNEEERLCATLDEAISYLENRKTKHSSDFTYEIIIVDDGSKDGTIRAASSYVETHGFETIRVLRVSQNRGKGHAVRHGMLSARGELLLFMDADGATRVSDLDLLEGELARVQKDSGSGHVGAVFGSRAHLERAAMAKRSPLRNFLTWGFHMCVTLVAGSRIRDTQCGFKLFTRRAGAMLFGNQRLQRWCFDVELLFLADQLNIPVAEVPVHWTEMPGSKIRFTSILHMAFELLLIKLSYQQFGFWKIYSPRELKQLASGANGSQ